MWISEIKIKNFRPFYGQGKGYLNIEFDKDSKSKFSIIEAKSDVGKTTFLAAIAWCLYGKETIDSTNKIVSPFCTTRLYEMKENEIQDLEVEITLNDEEDDEPVYVIKRIQQFQKNGENIVELGESKLEITEWEEDESRPIPDYSLKNVINGILPEDIHLFFMFEGEKLEKHFSFNNSENIQYAIERTSQIKQIKTAIKHLRNVRDDVWSSGDKVVDNDIEIKNYEITKCEEYIEDNTKKISEYKKQVGQATDEIAEIESFLEKYNVPRIQELSKQEKSLRENNKEFEDEIKRNKEILKELILKNAPLAMSCTIIAKLLAKFDEEKKRDDLEPNLDNRYIKELLSERKCVCGRPLDPSDNADKPHIELLKKKMMSNDISEIKELIREGRYTLNDFKKEIQKEFIDESDKINKEIQKKEGLIAKNVSELSEINDKLKDVNEKVVIEKQELKNTLIAAKEGQMKSLTRLEAAVKQKEAELSRMRQELDRLGKKKKGGEIKQQNANFLDRAINNLEKIEQEILSEVRKKVQDKTWQYFRTLHWDKEKYDSFVIEESYELSLNDYKGTNWMYNLASGPKQLLLLSFIAALSEVSGFKFPVFIDTPFANIDNEQRSNVAKMLPDYLKNRQVIMLMKDQEYTAEIRSLLKERVSKEMRFTRLKNVTEVSKWS